MAKIRNQMKIFADSSIGYHFCKRIPRQRIGDATADPSQPLFDAIVRAVPIQDGNYCIREYTRVKCASANIFVRKRFGAKSES